MGLYKYIAAAKGEAPHEILIEAENTGEALNKLRNRRMIPVKFCGEEHVGADKKFSFHRTKIDTYDFTRQLAPLLNSYIPLERALAIIAESSEVAEQRDFVNVMRQGLHEGKKFSELVRSNGRLFPSYYANLIESGEETGCLPDVVSHLFKFMTETREQRNFIISSSIYPTIIFSVTMIVTILLFVFLVPRFTKIFIDMGRATPPSINFLLAISSFLYWAWWMVPLGLVITWFSLRKILGEDVLREKTYAAFLRIPLFGRIIADLEMCKYIRTLSIMISNHVEIVRSVRIAGDIIHNPVISREFANIGNTLKGGKKLSSAFYGNPYVPKETVPMLRIGEESGTIGTMLERIADNLEADTRMRIKRLLSMFEPMVIVFLAVIVLLVVTSIFLAMMEINAIV